MEQTFIIDRSRLLPLYLLRTGRKQKQNHIIRKNGYGAYQLSFCSDGEGKFISGGVEHTIMTGDIFLFTPRIAHEYYAAAQTWSIDYFVFHGDAMPGLCDYLGIHDTAVFSLPDSHQIQLFNDLCQQLHTAFNSTQSGRDIHSSIVLYQMLSMLHTARLKQPAQSILEQHEHYKKLAPALDFMRNHFRENISLDDISAVINVSKSYLCRIFHKTYNMTPAQYLISLRISAAKKLLISTDIQTKKLALEVGFNDASYFCSTFKRYEGMTPEEFRRLHDDAY